MAKATGGRTAKAGPRTAAKAAPKAGAQTAAKRAAKAAPKAKAAEPVVVVPEAVVAGAELRKKELIDKVVERSDLKRREVKPAVEAALAVLGEAVAEGRGLDLRPFGKLRINRAEEKAGGRVTVCRLRQPGPRAPKEPLAETDE